MQLSPGLSVLDACAAPGGKLTHLLEVEPTLTVTAIEKEKSRIYPIKENLQRLQQSAKVICEDAANLDAWWDKQLYDRILLDAPCSASGVIRRHPDIKLLREPTDFRTLPQEQSALLSALWQTLKPGGLLVYITCSVMPEENNQVIKKFLDVTRDAEEEKITADWGIALDYGRQILPGMHEMDGFYYACLRKLQR
jgi:16S rRNA (cytosine967-C5)-methyltransferase